MKKLLSLLFIVILLGSAYAVWVTLGPNTTFSTKNKFLYVRTGHANRTAVMDSLATGNYIRNAGAFSILADKLGIWASLKPGRYEIKKGASLLDVARMLKNSRQLPVKLVINKVRTKEDLAGVLGRFFESDSLDVLHFLNTPDSVKALGFDTSNIMCAIIPNTYQLYWNTSPWRLLHYFSSERDKFWTTERKQQASALGMTPDQVYIMASIIEEETNKATDKPLIASVYQNRLKKGMPLQADPTVKFAMRDFMLKRIYTKYTRIPSPYNTYINKGLPPGPICTPSTKTLDATLTAPATDYIFFVAKPDFSGYSNFAATAAEHFKNAKAYQTALDSLMGTKMITEPKDDTE